MRCAVKTPTRSAFLGSYRLTAPNSALRMPATASSPSRAFSTAPLLLAPPRVPPAPKVQFTKIEQPAAKDAQAQWPLRSPPDPITNTSGASPFDAGPMDDGWSSPGLNSLDDIMRWAKPKETPIHLAPSTGRTVHVSGNVDAARAFQLLQVFCRRNKVAVDFNRQRFHERPGLKRKRLKSERWRKRFREGFMAAAKRARELANQGW